MSKTLIIHIGHYKTGTTALQIFFNHRKKFMTDGGIDYPDVWMHHAKHSAYAFSILRAAGVTKMMYDYADPTTPQDMWDDLYRHVQASPQDRVLISSEEFMRMGEYPETQEILHQVLARRPADLKVQVIAYLRPPQEHLQSWYNQLIKMKIPVAHLDQAVQGDIETIHYDYQRALAVWVNVLGAENVTLRPYVKAPDNPSALHQDFMTALGVELPQGFLQISSDPNPRLDNRMIELVRLMQNMDFPVGRTRAIRAQAQTYLEIQDRLAAQGPASGMTGIKNQALAGLEWLSGLPGCHVDIESFEKQLPEATPQEKIDQDLLLGFLLAELTQLRQRVKRLNLPELTQRLEALEQRMDEKDEGA